MFVGCSTLLSFQTVTSFDKNGSKSGDFVQRRFKHDATMGEISNWPTELIRNETKPLRNETGSLRTQTRDQRTTSLCQRRTSEGETVNSRTPVSLGKSFSIIDRGYSTKKKRLNRGNNESKCAKKA